MLWNSSTVPEANNMEKRITEPSLPDPVHSSKNSKSSWFWETVTFSSLAVISVFLIDAGNYPLVYLRYMLGAFFILGIPGYALSKALFPIDFPVKFKSENLDNVERVAFSVGISLVLVPSVGLLMNYTPWGISLNPIILSLYGLTLIFATIGLTRSYKSGAKISIDLTDSYQL